MNPTFDFNHITREMEMDSEDILNLMTLYQTELRRDLHELEAAVSNQEWPMTKEKLHKMKGDAANLCLFSFAETFEKMEHASLSKNPDVLRSQLHTVKALQEQFAADFQSYFPEAPTHSKAFP